MKQLIVSASLLLFMFAAGVDASDWLGRINELRSQPQTLAVTKQIAGACKNYATEFQQKGDWASAERWMKKAYDAHRSPAYQAHLASFYDKYAAHEFKSGVQRAGGYKHKEAKLLAQRALSYDDELATAHRLIGDIEFENNNRIAAQRAWMKAKKLNPKLAGMDKRLSKLDQEVVDEPDAAASVQIRFMNRRVDEETRAGMHYAIQVAREIVEGDFSHQPQQSLSFIVYSPRAYSRRQRGSHVRHEPFNNKIELPLDGEQDLQVAIATVFHEYTHAVIDDLGNQKCPRWLDEGLAEIQGQKIAARQLRLLPDAAARDELFPLALMETFVGHLDGDEAVLWSEQAFSMAAYLVSKYGYGRIRRLVSAIGQDIPFEVALRKTYGRTSAQIESEWKTWLTSS